MSEVQATKLAIVGMDACFGAPGLGEFARQLYDGSQPEGRDISGYPDSLLIQVASNAAQDAGLKAGQRVAVLVAARDESKSTALANEIVTRWRFSGAICALPDSENAVFGELQRAQSLLNNSEVEAVLLAAADLTGRNAGAVVLKEYQQARHEGGQIYSVVESVDLREGATSAGDIAQTCRASLMEAGIAAGDMGFLEVGGHGLMQEDEALVQGLNQAYRRAQGELSCAIGSVAATVGVNGAAAGMASLIKAALCLRQRFIPALSEWTGPQVSDALAGGSFYAVTQSKPWFTKEGMRRAAAIYAADKDGSCAHVILTEVAGQPTVENGFLRNSTPHLLLLTGDIGDALLAGLNAIERAIERGEPLATIARQRFAQHHGQPNARYTLAIVGRNPEEVKKEIEWARQGVTQALATDGEWSTPAGSCFTAHPVARKPGARVAFVYPGAFNSYPNLGRDLFHLFPRLYDHLASLTSDVGRAVGDELLYTRSLEKLSYKHWNAIRAKLESDPAAMMESGITFAVLFTQVMRDYFQVQPDMALGYSLGEGSMMWALGVWRDGDVGSEALRRSPVFTHRLGGPMEAVRDAWGLPPDAQDFWDAYFVSAPATEVVAAVEQEARVYLTHVNSPNEVMVAGDPAGCQRVLEALRCEYLRAPFKTAIHCEAMLSEYGEFFKLHHWPVSDVSNGTFYSAADYAPVRLEAGAIAHSIARMVCKRVDFPRLINRAYEDGARVFIELGPRNTCARWIGEILGARDHVAVSINQPGTDDRTAIIRMLAKLASHRLPMDLSPLYEIEDEPIATVRTPNTAVWDVEQEQFAQVNQMHRVFLQTRREALRQLGELMQLQMGMLGQVSGQSVAVQEAAMVSREETTPLVRPRKPALFYRADIEEFATGSIAACFGPEYHIYDNRRAPRIPNGDLLFMSTVLKIEGERYKSAPMSSILSEYDVPAEMWFYRDNAYPGMPYSVYMEIALQPCGFLSAYLGPTFEFPEADFYFRNLDGQGYLKRDVDLRGRTVSNRVRLLSSTTLEGVIIQKFDFALAHEGEVFFEGDATFGYFTLAALANQVGLDRGQETFRWYEQADSSNLPSTRDNMRRWQTAQPKKPYFRLPAGQLELLDELVLIPDGGRHGRGYIYGKRKLEPDDWFFSCHFYQDPVMPGSLGIEAIWEGVQAFAIETGLGERFRSPRFAQAAGHNIVWKYRGQVLAEHGGFHLETHIRLVEVSEQQTTIFADASLWRGNLRIYEVQGAAICIVEG